MYAQTHTHGLNRLTHPTPNPPIPVIPHRSGAGATDLYLVMTRTGGEGSGAKGITALLVHKEDAGVGFGAKERKLGWNSQPTRVVTFDDVRVPASRAVGLPGTGFSIAMGALDGGRVSIASCSVGGAQACFDAAVAYARERRQFGSRIADFQYTQFRLADMAAELSASRALVRAAARAVDRKSPRATYQSAMAKRYATDAGFRIANEALQIHGGCVARGVRGGGFCFFFVCFFSFFYVSFVLSS
jgi:alkylation response protein AidB-like acyl-CoA dehydrogenase